MIRGSLLTRFFLEDGIRETDAYRALDPAHLLAVADELRGLWADLGQIARPSESETEREFIYPVLERLGWE